MKKELELQLVNKYPFLFKDYGGDMRQTCMTWGCSCGDGWYNILDDLFAKLSKYPDVFLVQVKEKFGTLRVYTHGGTWSNNREINALISSAEKQSGETCERCGAPAQLNTDGFWLVTLCKECTIKRHNGYDRSI